MARKSKKLKIQSPPQNKINEDKENEAVLVHFDYSNSEYAEEHYGYYVMSTLTPALVRKNASPRVYLHSVEIKDHKRTYTQEFFDKTSLVRKGFRHRALSISVIELLFETPKSRNATKGLLRGLRYFIEYLDSVNKKFNDITDVDIETQKDAYGFIDSTRTFDCSRRIRELFSAVGKERHDFKVLKSPLTHSKDIKTLALPSSTVYQLNLFAEENIEEIIKSEKDMGNSALDGKMCRHLAKQEEMCFNLHKIYPFVLYFMIHHGLNLEVLASWKVRKESNGKYRLIADYLDEFIIVDGVKNRSNTIITSVITRKNKEGKYIDFLLRHLAPIYEKTGRSEFWQYYYCVNGGGFKVLQDELIPMVMRSENKNAFYNKYEIFDPESNRMKGFNHKRLRKSHNYQDFLQGKNEYERQLRKSHKSGDTTVSHYEQLNLEWREGKQHKIALTQNLLVGAFAGEISREDHEIVKLLDGPLGDCKDNRRPTFEGAPALRESEYCSDWTKCLSGCDKCKVIPRVHGPVIYAWMEYMEEEKIEFLNEQDWNKEYLLDYLCAEDTIKFFTPEEDEHCRREAIKHKEFVKTTRKYAKIVKVKQGEYRA